VLRSMLLVMGSMRVLRVGVLIRMLILLGVTALLMLVTAVLTRLMLGTA